MLNVKARPILFLIEHLFGAKVFFVIGDECNIFLIEN